MTETPEVADNKVYYLKLVTGEHVVARVKEKKDSLELVKPLTIAIYQTQSGETNASMPPFSPFSKSDNVTIDKTFVVFKDEATKEVSSSYVKLVSGLELPA
jgi:hypothetical protein